MLVVVKGFFVQCERVRDWIADRPCHITWNTDHVTFITVIWHLMALGTSFLLFFLLGFNGPFPDEMAYLLFILN